MLKRIIAVLILLIFFSPASPQDQRRLEGRHERSGGRQNQNRCPKSWKSLQQRYRRNKKKWETKAPSTTCYDMAIKPTCFCAPAYTSPHYVQVRRGKAQNSTTDEFAGQMPIINELFRILDKSCIRNCPKSGAAECRVEFDKRYGYITSLYIDQSRMIADEEQEYTVSSLAFCD